MDKFSAGRRKSLENQSASIIEGNVLDETSLKLVGDIDYIFHMGSPSSITLFNSNPQACFRETTEGWLNILNFAKHHAAKKVVFPSSGSVYGRTAPPQAETNEPHPSNLYAVSKLACEHIVEAIDNPPPTTVLRIFAGYGPGEDHKGPFASPVTLFLKSISRNERPVIYGDGSQT